MAFYALEEHEFRYRPLGGSFTAWAPVTVKPIPLPDIDIAEGDVQVRVKASGSRPAGAILASNAAFTVTPVENTTPAAPTVTGDDDLNILTASHALGDSEILYSENGGAFQQYTGALSIGDVDRAAGYWQFKIKAATGRNESATAASPAFTTTPVIPETFDTALTFATLTSDNDQGINGTVSAANANSKFEFNAIAERTGLPQSMTITLAGVEEMVIDFPGDYLGDGFRFTDSAGAAHTGTFINGTKTY